jgi:hypothetical protein
VRGPSTSRSNRRSRRSIISPRSRKAVEAGADLDDGVAPPVHGAERLAPAGGHPVDEQLDCPLERQWWHHEQELAGHAQGLAAGGEHPQVGAAGEQRLGQPGDVVDDVLAVVDQQHDAPVSQGHRHLVGRAGRRCAGQHALVEPQGADDGREHRGLVADRGEVDQPHPVGGEGSQRPGDLERQPGLAGATGPHQRDEPVALDELEHVGELALTPEAGRERPGYVAAADAGRGRGAAWGRRGESRRSCGGRARRRPAGDPGGGGRRLNAVVGRAGGGGDTRPHHHRGVERRILGQHRRLEAAQLGPRLDAELVDQATTRVLERTQRVALTAAPVEGEDKLGPQSFPQRVQPGEALELADHGAVAACRQLGVDAVLDGGELRLGEPGPLGARPALGRQPGQRLAPHEVEGLAQVDHRGAGIVGQMPAGPGHQRVKSLEIGGGSLARHEGVAGVGRLDQRGVTDRRQAAAQAGYQHLQRVERLPGRFVAVEDVDQPVG